MKKKLLYVSIVIVALTLGFFTTKFISQAVSGSEGLESEDKSKDEFMPLNEITDVKEDENMYVKLNNKLSKAIKDYEAGAISKKEYLAICSEIEKQTESIDGSKALESAEKEYKKRKSKK